MNAIISLQDFVQVKNSQPITTSEFIAKAFKKRHDNVLRDIDKLLNDIDPYFATQNFKAIETSTQNNLGFTVKNRAYELTKDGFMLLVMGFTGKTALAVKIAYIQTFNKMAEMLQLQSNKPTKSILSTVADRKPLKDAVVLLAKQKNISFPIAWKMVHHQFNVRTVEELTQEQVEKAIYYVQALSVDNTLYGEVLDKVEEPKPVIQSSLSRHYFTLLAKMVGYAKEYADIQKLLCEDYDSPKAQQYRSLISAATTPDTKGFLFVFRPNIREDVQQAAALLYQQSAYL